MAAPQKITDEQRRMYALEAAVSKEDDFPVRLDAHLQRMQAMFPMMRFTRRHVIRQLLFKALKAEEAKAHTVTKPKRSTRAKPKAKRSTKR